MRINKLTSALAIIGLATISSTAFATDGYFSHGYGVKAQGMGGVGIALPQDSLAAATNPAGMVLVGSRLDLGLTWFSPKRDATVNGINYKSESDNFYVPEFGYNMMLNPNMSLGVAVYGNGGMNSDYAQIPQFNTSGNRTGVDLAQLFVSPTFAMKFGETQAVGAALNFAYQRFKAYGIANFAGYSQDGTKLSDNGYDNSTGWGVRLGWTGEVAPGYRLGATWQSKTYMSKFGKYKGLFAEDGGFDIPENYGVGLAVKTAPEMTVAFDIMKIRYSQVKSIANNISTLAVGNLGKTNGAGFGWKDQIVYKLGVSYEYNKSLTLRAGFNHGDTPIDQQTEMAFNVLAPATVENHVTLGATLALSNNTELSMMYMHAFGNQLNGAAPQLSAITTSFKMYQNSLGVAYGMKF